MRLLRWSLGATLVQSIWSASCVVFMNKSTVPGAGRGIFSAIPLAAGTLVDIPINIPIRRDDIEGSQLDNYVFDTGIDDFVMLSIGIASILNHADASMTDHRWNEDTISAPLDVSINPQSTFSTTSIVIADSIPVNTEIFTNYGEGWMEDRERSSGPGFIRQKDFDFGEPICMSSLHALSSRIPNAGSGLFTKTAIKNGELITVSPTLVLPIEKLKTTRSSSVLWNYCISSPGAAVAVLPLVHIPIANHDNVRSNAVIRWFTVNDDASSVFNEPLQAILSASFAPLDLALYASSDIPAGEEILLDYGSQWQSRWEAHLRGESPQSPFREMAIVEDFFPPSWLTASAHASHEL